MSSRYACDVAFEAADEARRRAAYLPGSGRAALRARKTKLGPPQHASLPPNIRKSLIASL